jgi:hypothetical protein
MGYSLMDEIGTRLLLDHYLCDVPASDPAPALPQGRIQTFNRPLSWCTARPAGGAHFF